MEYKVEQVKVDDESLKQILDLFKLSFPTATKFNLDYLRWQYAENPSGNIIGFNAFSGNVLAAHYVCMPIYMNIQGRKVKGGLSLNTATHTEYQKKGLFSMLANKTYQYMANNGYEFVIGVANENSVHGFIKKLNFQFISRLAVKIGVGSKISVKKDFTYSRYWDNELLNWRLLNPSTRYCNHRDIIVSPMYYGVNKLMACLPSNVLDGLATLDKQKFDYMNLYIGLGADLSNGLYFNIPSFIKRPPFNLIFRDFTGVLPEMNKNNILFQLLDLDVS